MKLRHNDVDVRVRHVLTWHCLTCNLNSHQNLMHTIRLRHCFWDTDSTRCNRRTSSSFFVSPPRRCIESDFSWRDHNRGSVNLAVLRARSDEFGRASWKRQSSWASRIPYVWLPSSHVTRIFHFSWVRPLWHRWSRYRLLLFLTLTCFEEDLHVLVCNIVLRFGRSWFWKYFMYVAGWWLLSSAWKTVITLSSDDYVDSFGTGGVPGVSTKSCSSCQSSCRFCLSGSGSWPSRLLLYNRVRYFLLITTWDRQTRLNNAIFSCRSTDSPQSFFVSNTSSFSTCSSDFSGEHDSGCGVVNSCDPWSCACLKYFDLLKWRDRRLKTKNEDLSFERTDTSRTNHTCETDDMSLENNRSLRSLSLAYRKSEDVLHVASGTVGVAACYCSNSVSLEYPTGMVLWRSRLLLCGFVISGLSWHPPSWTCHQRFGFWDKALRFCLVRESDIRIFDSVEMNKSRRRRSSEVTRRQRFFHTYWIWEVIRFSLHFN